MPSQILRHAALTEDCVRSGAVDGLGLGLAAAALQQEK